MAVESTGGVRKAYRLTFADGEWVPEIVLTRVEPVFRPASQAETADRRDSLKGIYWKNSTPDSEKPATDGSA